MLLLIKALEQGYQFISEYQQAVSILLQKNAQCLGCGVIGHVSP